MRMLSPFSTDWSRRNLNPSLMVGDVFENFDRIFDNLASPTFAATDGLVPKCEINETNDYYLVSFDMPGVKKQDVKIEVKETTLYVSGERHKEITESAGQTNLRNERVYGRFERTLELPSKINTDKIEALYEDGVLNLAIPKAESAKSRTIQIQKGDGGFFSKLLGSKKDTSKELKDVKVS